MTKISVVMGVYNCMKNKKVFLDSISSILNQTFSDFEFIICDDGSTDDTYNFIKKIGNIDNRIKVIKNKTNLGLAATLNHCIKNSTGVYIARHDADDISLPIRFQTQIAFLEQNTKIHFVGSAFYTYDGTEIGKLVIKKNAPTKYDLVKDVCFLHPTTMFRKELFQVLGGYREDNETRRCEDYDLFMRAYAVGFKGENLEIPLLKYYTNPTEYLRRRKMSYYFELSSVLFKGNYKMGTLFPYGIIYSLKPAIAALVPSSVMLYIRQSQNKA